MESVDRKTTKTMKMYGAVHLNGDVDRLHVTRKEGERGLNSVEYMVRGAKIVWVNMFYTQKKYC